MNDRVCVQAVNRSTTTVAVDTSNRQFFVHTFLAEVLSLFKGIETLTLDSHSNP